MSLASHKSLVFMATMALLHAAHTLDASAPPSMMNGGANIYVMGILNLLVDVEIIPLHSISGATKTHQLLIDNCCTKRGYLPLTLDDGSIYYQECFYCKNASETIISPNAILQSSNILMHWQQKGHRDGSPVTIRFTSDIGLYSIKLTLEKCDGLYYCPTNIFAITPDPSYPKIPRIHRVAASSPPELPNVKRGHCYQPVSRSKLAESET